MEEETKGEVLGERGRGREREGGRRREKGW